MFPILLKAEILGHPFEIHTYGFLIALGFMVGIALAVREAKRIGEDPEFYLDLTFWILISALVGSRILFVVVNYRSYVDACFNPQFLRPPLPEGQCFEVFKIWKGGLVYYGGFLAAVGASYWFVRKNRLSFLKVSDIMIPSVSLGHFFGRLGCLAAGCCFGKAAQGPLGVLFPQGSVAHDALVEQGLIPLAHSHTMALHPTQLYEAAGELAIFVFLILLRKRKRFDGQVLGWYLILYPLLRSVVEIFRGDGERGFAFEVIWPGLSSLLGLPVTEPVLLSTSQLLSLLLAGAAALLMIRRRLRTPRVISCETVGPELPKGLENPRGGFGQRYIN